MTVVLKAKAGEGGRLFGAITSKQIAEALAGQKIKIDKRKIELSDPIRSLGVTQIPVKSHLTSRRRSRFKLRRSNMGGELYFDRVPAEP